MKKLFRLILIAILAFAMVMTVVHLALAQDQSSTDQKNSKKHGDRDHFQGFKKNLGLTVEQEVKLKNLFKTQNDQIKPLRDQFEVDKDKLKLQIDKNASDSDLLKTLNKISSDRVTLKAAREKYDQKMKAILTPKQQALMLLLRSDRRRNGFGPLGWGEIGGWVKHSKNQSWGEHGKEMKSKDSLSPTTADTDQN